MTTPIIPQSSGIYKITCIANGKIYIGSSCNLKERWLGHRSSLRTNKHYNQYLQRAWNKYGESNFIFEVIELVMPFILLDREQYWLDKLKPFNANGYNQNKIADKPPSAIGRIVSQETREKISEGNKGRKPSKEAIENLRIVNTGRKHSLEEIEKVANALRGRKRPQDAIEKTAAAHRGVKKKPESIAKRTEKRSLKWIVTTPDGLEIEICNLNLFCRINGLNQGHMGQIARGKCEQYKGWKCRYA